MNRLVKALVICGLAVLAVGWLTNNKASKSAEFSAAELATLASDDYVGSDACKDCHEDQFKAFSHTSHAQLTKISSWKGKVTGCEACTFCSAAMFTAGCTPLDCMAALAGGNRLPSGRAANFTAAALARAEGSIAADLSSVASALGE